MSGRDITRSVSETICMSLDPVVVEMFCVCQLARHETAAAMILVILTRGLMRTS
jgi:hypothetical protein